MNAPQKDDDPLDALLCIASMWPFTEATLKGGRPPLTRRATGPFFADSIALINIYTTASLRRMVPSTRCRLNARPLRFVLSPSTLIHARSFRGLLFQGFSVSRWQSVSTRPCVRVLYKVVMRCLPHETARTGALGNVLRFCASSFMRVIYAVDEEVNVFD